MTIYDHITQLLRAHEARFSLIEHAHAQTAAEAAAARGTPLHIGGKSLVFKLGSADARFAVFAISGARRTQSRLIRRALGVQRLRFATREELMRLTDLTPGCVPPFGRPVFDAALYVDQSIADNDEIAFSAGRHTASIRMSTADYLRAAQPEAIFRFSTIES